MINVRLNEQTWKDVHIYIYTKEEEKLYRNVTTLNEIKAVKRYKVI